MTTRRSPMTTYTNKEMEVASILTHDLPNYRVRRNPWNWYYVCQNLKFSRIQTEFTVVLPKDRCKIIKN